MAPSVTLSDAQLERLADLVADRLRSAADPTPAPVPVPARRFVSVAELADMLGVDRKTIYRNAVELGGRRVTKSAKSPWRFDVDQALAATITEGDRSRSERPQVPSTPAKPRRKRAHKSPAKDRHCQLLPIGRVQDRGDAR